MKRRTMIDGFEEDMPVDVSTSNKQAVLPCPYYSNPYWNQAQTIFGARTKGLSYEYDDRLQQWDYEKDRMARDEAAKTAKPRTAAFFEKFLSIYHGRPVELMHIMAGCNLANGFPYYVFGFRNK
jgi:hypothetical protein